MFFSYFYPQTIARFSSEFNRDIRVVLEYGRYKILVNGSPQSGLYIEKLWKRAFAAFGMRQQFARSPRVLMLGVAGGSVLRVIGSYFPFAAITGVDIDPVMLRLGKTYFQIHRQKHVKLVCLDARTFLANHLGAYDLIVSDIYFGRSIPKFVAQRAYVRSLRRALRPSGRLIVSVLHDAQYRDELAVLRQILTDTFGAVSEKSVFLNTFFFAV